MPAVYICCPVGACYLCRARLQCSNFLAVHLPLYMWYTQVYPSADIRTCEARPVELGHLVSAEGRHLKSAEGHE